MNTVNTHSDGDVLQVQIHGHFNLHAKNLIENRISKSIKKLEIDLSSCNLIDSEGVLFMYNFQREGRCLDIQHPPDILFEILDILELREQWDQYYHEINQK